MNNSVPSGFKWTLFYSQFADRLLTYKQDRVKLLSLLEMVYKEINMKYPFAYHGDVLTDIDPFTVFAAFNKGITNDNRIKIMSAIGNHIGVQALPPDSFDGIPVMNNMKSWFISANQNRNVATVDILWELFETAISLADSPNEAAKQAFIKSYDQAVTFPLINWNITMGLYWIRPFFYLNLDGKNRSILLNTHQPYVKDVKLITDLKKLPDAKTYLALIDMLQRKIEAKSYSVNSFPELSQSAWLKSKEGAVPTVGKRYWLYSPGEGAKQWDEFYSNGLMGIDFVDIGDLSRYGSREDMRKAMKKQEDDSKSYKTDSLADWQFAYEMQVGDVVFAKKGMFELIGRGLVESEYMYMPDLDEYKHIRKVKWTHHGCWEHPGQAAMKTLTDITPYTDYVQKLELLITGDDAVADTELEIAYEKYTAEDFLDEVFINEEQYETLLGLMSNKKNLILQGAPGVGKTFAAKRLAYSIIGEKDASRVMMVQFHQSYSYEDFIMGFRPFKEGFELKEGPFYSFCKRAKDDQERNYYFIIDEINRGNLSKIFGELLMLIESDKRNEQLRLLYSNELFSVPSNVYIIGLMNTADRGLAMIDYALRRRFAFYEMKPAFNSDGFQSIVETFGDEKFSKLIKSILALNEDIINDDSLGEGFQIGHSYFCTDQAATTSWLKSVVTYEILPLLNEYWFDDRSKVSEWSKKLYGALND